MHDAGKAREPWQNYITASGKSGDRVFHAPASTALFFCASFNLLSLLDEMDLQPASFSQSRGLALVRVRTCLDIADHHTNLSDIGLRPPWERAGFSADHLSEIDLVGLSAFVSESLGYKLRLDRDECMEYLRFCADDWRKVSTIVLPRLRRHIESSPSPYTEAARTCIRMGTACFIAGDRYHAGALREAVLTKESARESLLSLERALEAKAADALEKGASPALVRVRGEAQSLAVKEYVRQSERRLYRLRLPTGLGKTMAALRVALTACSLGHAERIVYVGPYLSVLSQATKEIREATGMEVLQHHHLSVIQKADLAEDDDLLLLESWQAPIVTTTFNQMFLALFPRRAHQAMRLRALDRSFVIVDEPQIIDRTAWKVFLRMLEALTDRANASVLFTTATMPPTAGGLSVQPADLIAREFRLPNRYKIEYLEGEHGAEEIATMAARDLKAGKNVAVVMNTIRSAAAVYRALMKAVSLGQESQGVVHFLSGALIPVHKSAVIDGVKNALECSHRVAVVSTQVLEAGVDLSFRRIYRENPIIPSIVQVSGRGNRHGEGSEPALITVFDYVDDSGRSKRPYVYRSNIWREETDRLLRESAGRWTEEETSSVLSSFYNACYERSPDEGLLPFLVDAACGVWSALEAVKPFAEERAQVDVFVPWEGPLPDYVHRAMSIFDIHTVQQAYDRYLDPGFLRSLSFAKRKVFLSMLQSTSVSLGFKAARSVADSGGGKGIWRLISADKYHPVTGLSEVGDTDVSTLFV